MQARLVGMISWKELLGRVAAERLARGRQGEVPGELEGGPERTSQTSGLQGAPLLALPSRLDSCLIPACLSFFSPSSG